MSTKITLCSALIIQILLTFGIFYIFHHYSSIFSGYRFMNEDKKSKVLGRTKNDNSNHPDNVHRHSSITPLKIKSNMIDLHKANDLLPVVTTKFFPQSVLTPSQARAIGIERLNSISLQTLSREHPFKQDIGPPLIIYDGISRPHPNVSTSFELIATLVTSYQREYDQISSVKRGCRICVEHHYTAYFLWKDYIQPHYYSSRRELNYKGYYFEMGALDGISGSNSLFFDEYLNWDGILIEANPPNFAKTMKNRPYATKVEMAACACDKSDRFSSPCQLEFIGDYGGTGGATTYMTKNVRQAFHGTRRDTYKVSCLSLADIFEKANVTKIDVFSLDVEGAEYSTLLTIDFTRVKIWLIVVEQNTKVESSISVRNYLQKKGFIFKMNLGEMNELWENPSYFS